MHIGELPVIKASAAHPGVVQLEAERFHQMQLSAGVGSQAHHVACVRWYLRLVKDDVERHLIRLALTEGRS